MKVYDKNGNLLTAFAPLPDLNDLSDVNVPSPTDGYVLYWDNASSLWKCKAVSSSKIVDADGDTSWDVEQTADEDKIHGKVKGVEAFLLEDDGILTLAKQSAARGYKAADQSIPNASWTIFAIDNTSFDIQSEINTTTHRFVAKKAGIYLAAAGMAFHSNQVVADKMYGMGITLNGNFKVNSYLHSSHVGFMSCTCTEILQMAVGDWLDLRIFQSSGAAKNVMGTIEYTHLSVAKIA